MKANFCRAAGAALLVAASLSPPSAHATPLYTVTDLGQWQPTAINDVGQIVGNVLDPSTSQYQAVLWSGGTLTPLGSSDVIFSYATDINNLGQAAGYAQIQLASQGNPIHAVKFTGSSMIDLGTFDGGNTSQATGINNSGQVVGVAAGYVSYGGSPVYFHDTAFLNSNGAMIEIGSAAGFLTGNYAAKINNNGPNGQVIGNTNLSVASGFLSSFIYDPNSSDPYTIISPSLDYILSTDINDLGQVVGWTYNDGFVGARAFLYQNGVMNDLPDAARQATAINNNGQVIGYGEGINGSTGNFQSGMFLYENGNMKFWDELIPENSGWSMSAGTGAYDINNNGQIVGVGYYGSEQHGFLLTPIAPPPSVATLAKLSNDVYNTLPVTIDKYSPVGGANYLNGFAANVYHDGNQYVIAVRGTDPKDLSTKAYNLLSDASFATGSPDPNLVASVSYLAGIVNQLHIDHPDAIITLTGHSLGGAIAQIVGNYDGLRTITFDAPGPKALLSYFDNHTQLFQSGIPSPSSQIIDYRLYGDQVSRVGDQIGTTVTYDNPAGQILANLPWMFLLNHNLDTLVSQIINNATQASDIPFSDINWASSIIFALSSSTEPTLLSYALAVSDAVAHHYFDPPPGSTYSVVEQNGSPKIGSIQLPIYGPIAGWELKYLGDDGWHDYELASNGIFDFSSGAMGVNFYPVDINGNEIAQIDPFLFDLTFLSAGTFSASLDVGNDFVQVPNSSVPEPASLALLGLGLAGIAFSRRRQI